MARIARVVVPGVPHLIIQRGAENKQVFFSADDFREYQRLVGESCKRWDVKIWSYCMMPNHVHLVVEPSVPESLARSLGEAHRVYAKRINERDEKAGRVWHARFSSCAIEPQWLGRAMRYVERDPVDSGMMLNAADYPWSSAAGRVKGGDDPLSSLELPEGIKDWASFVAEPNDEADTKTMLAHERTGRPLGDKEWVLELEKQFGRRLRPRKRGRKPKNRPVNDDD